ncbi:hypothetical protein J6K27_003510 [Rhodococcus qingshengii]|uniref:hypothetical protein n=1 Tax=Rhodococcus qingshengii TaxID=334542 RepID=UPI001AEFF3F6|nr:hypothetical protein [Rhodococcus qingshengii]QTR98382.1 hypothetical protein J6K27_003510 [Rhodococcus qingshengii]
MTGVDVEHTKAQLDKAQIENGEVAADRSRYRMSIPANPDRDTDLIIGAALTAAEALVAAVERVQAIAEHWSTCPKGDYDCSDCNYNRPEAGDLLLEALKLETP